MSRRRRIASLSVATVTTAGLCVAIGVAAPVSAEPCTGTAAAAQPPAGTAALPSPGAGGPPMGHRPAGANDNAPLPRLGKLTRSLLSALTPAQQIQQQAAVVPTPKPTAAPATAATPAPVAAPMPAPGTSLIGWVTGPDSSNNTIAKYSITGTDLGIMWDNGNAANHQVLMAFGDTYGYCSTPQKQWRYNVLMRSQDTSLTDSVAASSAPSWRPGLAKQIINSIDWAPVEKGIIPTAGISVGNNQYVNFMSIKNWDADGRWSTNFSGVAVSPDNGEHWGVYPTSIRPAAPDSTDRVAYTPGNENFQMGAFMKPGPGDGYLYSFGTPPGRGGSAYVARVQPANVPDVTKYEYWNSDSNSWVPGNPGAATVVIPGPLGEMSAQYNTYLKQYVALYCNGLNDVVMRTAPAPQGPWGPEAMLVSHSEFPGGIYAPFLHPWSTGKVLYYNLSLWSDYNVMLMRTVLS